MNKNTILGLLLIFGILIAFSIYNSPSKEKIKSDRENFVKDSLAHTKHIADSAKLTAVKKDTVTETKKDSSVATEKIKNESGIFSSAATGDKKFTIIETDLLRFKFSNLGGRLYSVQLKKFKTFEAKPLILFDGDSTRFSLNFYSENRNISTGKYYFEPYFYDKKFSGKDSISITGNDSVKFAMRLYPDSSVNADKKKFIEFQYVISGNDYMIHLNLNFTGLGDILAANSNSIGLDWNSDIRQQEKSRDNEKIASTIYYKFMQEDVDYLSESKNDNKSLDTKVQWISFKQQFFSSALIADKGFANAKIATVKDDTSKTLKNLSADITIPFDNNSQSFAMRWYFGPNHFKTLKKYGLDLERQIPLGWSFFLFKWINTLAVIPVFNWLQSTGMSYGIIILILTLLLKIVLFPIAFKTYSSSAKMRVLKPEIDEINKKFPKEKAMERQQATMSLYKKAGVNPLSGCVPMLLQMPILIALYRFFPASIELRQQSFLWASDLSTYDSILDLGFKIPFYGDHVSLFTLLMTVTTIIYTKVNNQLMGAGQQQMPGMKFMMYAMPVMFLGFFNNFAAGLSYYYFLANIFTFLQMWIIRNVINEEKIHAKIQENKKRPTSAKKSGFQKRLEDMAKQRGYNAKKK
jgi:YidC/Oxa1 family membrane protein insertase